MARSLLVVVCPPVLLSLEERGACARVLSFFNLLIIYIWSFSDWYAFQIFLINGEALDPTGLCLIWFRVTIFSLVPILPCSLFKAVVAYHPVIQRKVDELLAKGAIEPSSGGAGFYSSMFVVPKHTRGL